MVGIVLAELDTMADSSGQHLCPELPDIRLDSAGHTECQAVGSRSTWRPCFGIADQRLMETFVEEVEQQRS